MIAVFTAHCRFQKKRNRKLTTYKPCNNCIFYCWDVATSGYTCKRPKSVREKENEKKILF